MEPRVLDLADVTVCDFATADIADYLDYWYGADAEHLAAMGVDTAKLPAREKMREMLEWNIECDVRRGKKKNAVVSIRLKGKTVGVHELTHFVAHDDSRLPGYRSAVMHAHIWRPEHRRLGIGLVSYVRAMGAFFERFALEVILFETPANNAAANRIKSKLGIDPVGVGTLDLPIFSGSVRTVRYGVSRNDLPAIEKRMQESWRSRGNTIRGSLGAESGSSESPAAGVVRP